MAAHNSGVGPPTDAPLSANSDNEADLSVGREPAVTAAFTKQMNALDLANAEALLSALPPAALASAAEGSHGHMGNNL